MQSDIILIDISPSEIRHRYRYAINVCTPDRSMQNWKIRKYWKRATKAQVELIHYYNGIMNFRHTYLNILSETATILCHCNYNPIHRVCDHTCKICYGPHWTLMCPMDSEKLFVYYATLLDKFISTVNWITNYGNQIKRLEEIDKNNTINQIIVKIRDLKI